MHGHRVNTTKAIKLHIAIVRRLASYNAGPAETKLFRTCPVIA